MWPQQKLKACDISLWNWLRTLAEGAATGPLMKVGRALGILLLEPGEAALLSIGKTNSEAVSRNIGKYLTKLWIWLGRPLGRALKVTNGFLKITYNFFRY